VAFREENQRARREVELTSVRDSTTTPHRRSLTGGAHSSSRLAPMTLTRLSRRRTSGLVSACTRGRSDRHRGSSSDGVNLACACSWLGGTPSRGRATLYPEGVRYGAFHPLPLRLGLPGFGEPRGPLYGRCRTRSPTTSCWPSTRSRPMRCCTDQAEASRSRWSSTSTTTELRRRSWIMAPSPRPASQPIPTPTSSALAGGACGCWSGWSMRSVLNASGLAPG
jgi:hypothetical protein